MEVDKDHNPKAAHFGESGPQRLVTVCPSGHRLCPRSAGRPSSRWNRERIGPGRQPAHLWVAGVRDQSGEARVLATLRAADVPPHLAVMRVGGPRPGLILFLAPYPKPG